MANAQALKILRTPARVNEPFTDDSTTRSNGKDLIGRVLNERYELIARIKRGGMGTVYLARHVAIGKRVAIKILSTQYSAQRDIVRRFLQEARATSELRHPNIVDVSDFGYTDDGQAYLVMEYLEGEDLAETVRRDGPLPWIRAAPMLLQVCIALDAAHRCGIIHRDIKPSNCFRIFHAGDPDFIKLLDFGVAKVLGATHSDEYPITDTGTILGTLDYMAPELFASGTVDARVDVYAVGMLTCKLLTDKIPFSGTAHEKVLRIVRGDLMSPSQLAPHLKIPAGVEATIMRALHTTPGERFQTIQELAAAFLTQLSVPSPEVTTMLKSGSFAALSIARFLSASTHEEENDTTTTHRRVHAAAHLSAELPVQASTLHIAAPRLHRRLWLTAGALVSASLVLLLVDSSGCWPPTPVGLATTEDEPPPSPSHLRSIYGALAPQPAPAPAPAPTSLARHVLDVRSSPAGAMVAIDGRPAGIAGSVRQPLAPGVHIITCRRPGHVTATLRIELASNRRVNCRLHPEPHGDFGALAPPSSPAEPVAVAPQPPSPFLPPATHQSAALMQPTSVPRSVLLPPKKGRP